MDRIVERVLTRHKSSSKEEDAKEHEKVKRWCAAISKEMLAFAEEMEKFENKIWAWEDEIPRHPMWEDIPNIIERARLDMGKSVSKLRENAHRF